MRSELFRLQQVNLWGDYGDVLVSGYMSRDDASGDVLLYRGGPFTPPLFFPWSSLCGRTLIVTDSFRQDLERAPFGPLTFKPVVKDRIVHLSFAWERWDRTTDTPRKRPTGGEAEAYLMGKPHSVAVAAAMPDFWEVLPPVLPCRIERQESRRLAVPDQYYFTAAGGGDYRGLFRDRETWFDLIVDQPTRDWFERVGEWVSFQPLVEK
jgi:hypothetical protein